MRTKIVFPILGLGLALLLLLLLARQGGNHNANSAPLKAQATELRKSGPDLASVRAKEHGKVIAASASGTTGGAAVTRQSLTNKTLATNGLTREEYVDQRVGELMDLAMNDDSASLNTILAELNNGDADIRKGAIEAVKQFGSTDAIPKLEEAAARANDGTEKKALEEAIEFLKLPPLTARKN